MRAAPLCDLTDREAELLALMAAGRSNQAISHELLLSARTVESHVASIYRKLAGGTGARQDRRVVAVLRYLDATAASGDAA